MEIRFSLYVSYSQLAVFDASLTNPFNDWSPDHVDQGFAWRPGSASFKTVLNAIDHAITVVMAESFRPLAEQAVRIIEVPFTVPEHGAVEVASIEDKHEMNLPAGQYSLRYEAFADPRIHFVLQRNQAAEFRILRADNELAAKYPLTTTARPA